MVLSQFTSSFTFRLSCFLNRVTEDVSASVCVCTYGIEERVEK